MDFCGLRGSLQGGRVKKGFLGRRYGGQGSGCGSVGYVLVLANRSQGRGKMGCWKQRFEFSREGFGFLGRGVFVFFVEQWELLRFVCWSLVWFICFRNINWENKEKLEIGLRVGICLMVQKGGYEDLGQGRGIERGIMMIRVWQREDLRIYSLENVVGRGEGGSGICIAVWRFGCG